MLMVIQFSAGTRRVISHRTCSDDVCLRDPDGYYVRLEDYAGAAAAAVKPTASAYLR